MLCFPALLHRSAKYVTVENVSRQTIWHNQPLNRLRCKGMQDCVLHGGGVGGGALDLRLTVIGSIPRLSVFT